VRVIGKRARAARAATSLFRVLNQVTFLFPHMLGTACSAGAQRQYVSMHELPGNGYPEMGSISLLPTQYRSTMLAVTREKKFPTVRTHLTRYGKRRSQKYGTAQRKHPR
jgi:hypothetical protein